MCFYCKSELLTLKKTKFASNFSTEKKKKKRKTPKEILILIKCCIWSQINQMSALRVSQDTFG